MESPLQEMNVCRGLGCCGLGTLLGRFFAGLLSWQGKDELWVLSSGSENALVGGERDRSADIGWVIGMSQAPKSFDLFRRKLADFLNIQV